MLQGRSFPTIHLPSPTQTDATFATPFWLMTHFLISILLLSSINLPGHPAPLSHTAGILISAMALADSLTNNLNPSSHSFHYILQALLSLISSFMQQLLSLGRYPSLVMPSQCIATLT